MKSELRSEILGRIRAMPVSVRESASSKIKNRLMSLIINTNEVWGAYMPLADEPQISWNDILPEANWAYPEVISESSMEFKTKTNNFRTSKLGVREPVGGSKIEMSELRGLVVPAISYDKYGLRLGRGRGYYDRSLENFKGTKIGVCFETALVEKLPSEPHDLRVHYVVTEKETYQVGNSEGDLKWN